MYGVIRKSCQINLLEVLWCHAIECSDLIYHVTGQALLSWQKYVARLQIVRQEVEETEKK